MTVMAHLLFFPKLESLSSASSPRIPKTLLHLPLTPMPEGEVQGSSSPVSAKSFPITASIDVNPQLMNQAST